MSGGRRPLAATRRALAALRERGLLMLHDAEADSLTTRVAGEPVRGSWWGHARGREIFAAATALEDHPDVETAKLIDGKVTFVHRTLWASLAAVGGARALWQIDGLSDEAKSLLARIDAGERYRDPGPPGRELEAALLCRSRQVHTASGKHVLELLPWSSLVGRAPIPDEAAARAALEAAASAIGAAGRLPWPR